MDLEVRLLCEGKLLSQHGPEVFKETEKGNLNIFDPLIKAQTLSSDEDCVI